MAKVWRQTGGNKNTDNNYQLKCPLCCNSKAIDVIKTGPGTLLCDFACGHKCELVHLTGSSSEMYAFKLGGLT